MKGLLDLLLFLISSSALAGSLHQVTIVLHNSVTVE